jgi:hypothetical protein
VDALARAREAAGVHHRDEAAQKIEIEHVAAVRIRYSIINSILFYHLISK